MDSFVDAVITGLATIVVLGVGVVALAAAEARLLDPRRGVVGALARALRQATATPRPLADAGLGVAAAVLAVSVPTAALALVLGGAPLRQALEPVAAGLLCLGAMAPLLAAVAAGVDERARLGLYDALASTSRRLLVLVACAVSTTPTAFLVVAPFAMFVLVRGRYRGAPTFLPRWEDGLSGRALLFHRLGERAVVVAVGTAAGVDARALLAPALSAALVSPWSEVLGVVGAAVVPVVLGGGAVVATRLAGPLRGEGVLGPLWVLAAAALAKL